MSEKIKYADAFAAHMCGTGARQILKAVGLDFRHFHITGYSADELYAAFGAGHPLVKAVVDHKAKKDSGASDG